MKKDLKNFIENAVKIGKDKNYVRDYLYGKVSDLEVARALEYFDYLQKNKEKSSKNYLLLIISFFKIVFIYLIYLFLKLKVSLKKIFLKEEKEEKIDLEIIEKNIGLTNIKNKFYNWFSRKSQKEKKRLLILSLTFFIIFIIFIYANFFYYKKCENKTCFIDRIEKCDRAIYESEDFIMLTTKIEGMSFKKCISDVIYVDKETNKKLKMRCSLPIGYSFLPYANLEFCSGKLRDFIQEKIISEINKVVGENLIELNSFFKR